MTNRQVIFGSAGQSFGAFLSAPLTLELDGEANDGAGKGMSGGTIVVRGVGAPDEPAIGNACFYGARGGEAYVRGTAGERLAVRNSGANAVVMGRSDIVGKPMALLLLHANATVTICHSKTRNMKEVSRRADIVVAAMGRAAMITEAR